MKAKRTRAHPVQYCRICKSPYRAEIELLLAQKIPRSTIANRYYVKFNNTPKSFTALLTRHERGSHPPFVDPTPPPDLTPEEIEARKDPATFKEYADKLLNIGFSSLDPKKITPNHVISAQRAILEEKKIEGAQKTQEIMIMKFFRGSRPEIVEGEVKNGLDAGTDVPTNTE